MSRTDPVVPSRQILRRLPLLLLVVLSIGLSGCSLFVMAGKLLLGDPRTPALFREQTGVDLSKGEHKLLVICRTPHMIRNQRPTFEYDLTDGLHRRLRQHGVKTIPADKVLSWLDNNGGDFRNVSEIARDFETDYIAVVHVQQASFYEENSPEMFKGHAEGTVSVYERKKLDGRPETLQIFTGEFRTEYPRHHPIPVQQMGERGFQKQFVDHLCSQIASKFHDSRVGDDF